MIATAIRAFVPNLSPALSFVTISLLATIYASSLTHLIDQKLLRRTNSRLSMTLKEQNYRWFWQLG